MSSLSRLLSFRRTFSTSISTTTTTVKSLSTDLYKERSLKRLVEKFKKSSESPRFRTKAPVYDNTIKRLAAAKKFKWIEEILEDQKQYHHDMSKEGFASRIITLYGKSGMFDNARKVFDEMPKRTVLSFNALLGACVSAKKFDFVGGLFRDVPGELGLVPDLVSYNTVIKGFVGTGDFDSAVKILDEMEKKGIEPDAITFNTLLSGFYVNGKFADGEKMWGRMVERKVVPDVRSYNARLYGLATEKRAKEAVDLFEEMKGDEVKPDVYSYNALIRGFVNELKLEEAKMWYNEMEKNDCSPNRMTFVVLLPFLCEMGDLGFAFQLCKKIFAIKCGVDRPILQLVVDELVKESKVQEAEAVVLLGKTNGFLHYKLTMPSKE